MAVPHFTYWVFTTLRRGPRDPDLHRVHTWRAAAPGLASSTITASAESVASRH